jgi:ABC-type taurine transport system substrate-binding protein
MTAPDGDAVVQAALDQAAKWLDAIPGVTAIGQGEHDGHPTVDVWVTDREWANDLPDEVSGIAVRVHYAGGPIKAQPREGTSPGEHPTSR